MTAPAWRDIGLHLAPDGEETTAGAQFDSAVTLAADDPDQGYADVVELVVAVDALGRPHDALEIIQAFRSARPTTSPAGEPWVDNAEGIAASHAGQVERAERAYARMVASGEAMPPGEERDYLLATAKQNLGMHLVEREPDRAIELLRDAAQDKIRLDDVDGALDIMMSAGLAQAHRGNLHEAVEVLSFVVDIARKARDPRLLSAAYANRGGVFASAGRLAEAEADFRAGIRYAARYGVGQRLPMALLNMGGVMADLGHFGRAMRYYRRGIREAQRFGSAVEEIRLRRALAVALARRRRFGAADAQLRAARELAVRVEDPLRAALVDSDLAIVDLIRGRPQAAAERLAPALDVLRASAPRALLRTALMNYALAQSQLNERDQADAATREALSLTSETEHPFRARIAETGVQIWTTPPAHGQRAADYLRLQLDEMRAQDIDVTWATALGAATLDAAAQSELALGFFDEAAALAEDRADTDIRTLWQIRNDRATALVSVGRFDDAMHELRWCEGVGADLDDRALRLHALSNLGEVERRAGLLDEGTRHLQQAVAIADALLDRESLAMSLGNLALTRSDAGDPQQARALYEREAEVANELGDPRLQASAVAGLAGVAFADDPAQSASGYELAARLLGGQEPDKLVEYRANALLSWARAGRSRRLQGAGQRLVDTAQQFGLEDQAVQALVDTGGILLDRGERDGALSFHAVAIRLLLTWAARLDSPDDLPAVAPAMSTTAPTVTEPPAVELDTDTQAALDMIERFAQLGVPALGEIMVQLLSRHSEVAGDPDRYLADLVAELEEATGPAPEIIGDILSAARQGIEAAIHDNPTESD